MCSDVAAEGEDCGEVDLDDLFVGWLEIFFHSLIYLFDRWMDRWIYRLID